MKTISKVLIAAIIAILISSAVPSTAFAYTYNDKSGSYQYRLVDNSDSPDYGAARIDRYQGSESVLSIPQKIDGHKVIRFESGSFASNYSVKEVIIPEGVTYIGPSAFFHCTSLEKVTIPNSVTKIDENAFALCEQLKEVVILNHTVDIYRNAFELCHPSLTINAAPDTVYEKFAKVHRLGFKSNCSDDYTPPAAGSVFGTGTTALLCGGCVIAGGIISAIITVMIKKKKSPKHLSILLTGAIIAMLIAAPGQASAYTDGGRSGNYRYNVLDDGSAQIDHYDGSESVLSIPQKLDGRKVTEIDDFAFNNRDYLKEVIIPEGVTSIGRNAFYNCPSLEKVTIPDSVTKIDKMAFAWCEQLKEVTVLNHTVDICKDGFEEYTSVTIISAPDTIYEKYAKEYCLGFKSNCSDDYTPPASGSVFGTGTTALLCGGCVIAGGLVSAVITSAVMKKKKEETE